MCSGGGLGVHFVPRSVAVAMMELSPGTSMAKEMVVNFWLVEPQQSQLILPSGVRNASKPVENYARLISGWAFLALTSASLSLTSSLNLLTSSLMCVERNEF